MTGERPARLVDLLRAGHCQAELAERAERLSDDELLDELSFTSNTTVQFILQRERKRRWPPRETA